jgi:hypothetical protein
MWVNAQRRDQARDLVSCGLIPPNAYVRPDGSLSWHFEHESYDDHARGALDELAQQCVPHIGSFRKCVKHGARLGVHIHCQFHIDYDRIRAEAERRLAQWTQDSAPQTWSQAAVWSSPLFDFPMTPDVTQLVAVANEGVQVWMDVTATTSNPGPPVTAEPTP